MDPAIYIETDIPPGITLDEWRTRTVRPSRTRVMGRLRPRSQRRGVIAAQPTAQARR